MAVPPAGRQPAYPTDQKFWAALPQATVDNQDCLQFAEGTSLLGEWRFMIRACYKMIAMSWTHNLKTQRTEELFC